MVHRQADDLVGDFGGHWQVFGTGTGQAAISAEGADERVEIPTTQHTIGFHLEVKLITGLAKLLGIDKDGKITVVMPHILPIVDESHACYIAPLIAVLHPH